MQIEAHNQKWYVQEVHDTKKHDQGLILLFFHQLLFLLHIMKWTFFVKWSTTTKMES